MALGHESARRGFLDHPGLDLALLQRRHQPAVSQAHHLDLGDTEPRAREEREEPRVGGIPGRRDADTQPRELLHGADRAIERGREEQRHGGRRREREDETRRLAPRARAEAQDRLERGRGEIDLRLRERLGGADLGARRPERDGQALAGEVALGVGDPQRQVLGRGRRPADRDRQGLEQEDEPDHD